MSFRKIIFYVGLIPMCVLAQNNATTQLKFTKLVKNIPYDDGDKSLLMINAETALAKHPMLSNALHGVVKNANHCILFQYDFKKRSVDDIRSTQFNGGELKINLTYFCYDQEKGTNDNHVVKADVVLKIEGDFSPNTQKIIDPNISHSKCYSHYCGSN